MAFAVTCKSCQARFLLNDDLLRRKVAGRVVTVRCRQCHATIEVDASEVDPKTLPAATRPEPLKPEPPRLAPKAPKPTPSPPRPAAKSTLMGIGAPRPGAATELVALSPGLLNMSVPSPTAPAAPAGARGFPEPPPPPSAVVEELSASDWEITETPPLAKADSGPESVDDFIEELPPSLPPPEEELPSSTGTPSLQALAHHDEQPQKPRSDDFLANMSAAMNGGIMSGADTGAPTIDVSDFATEQRATEAPSIDVSVLDVPLAGKQTLPLFALTDDASPPGPAPAAATKQQSPAPNYARPAPSPAGGSLSPSAVDRPAREGDDNPRERKNVVAPATNSVPPAAAGQRRSGLAAPVLLALAVAAGFLIWKRNSGHRDALAQAEQSTPAAEAPRTPAPPPPTPAPEATLAAAPAAPAPAEDDVTFETAPTKSAAPTTAANKPSTTEPAAATTPTPAVEKPAVEKPVAEKPAAEPKPEPATPAVKEPSPPSGEPAGPFDRAAAAAALNSGAAQASSCRKDGDPSGVASVTITFAPSGRVTSANISGPPFAGTPTGGCIAAALRKARVPAFEGDRVTVSKTIVIQ